MICILTTFLTLLRCENPYYCFQQWICPCTVRIQQVVLFFLPSIHRISDLEKTKFYQHSILSSLMSKHPLQVVPFYDAAQFDSSEEIDFHVWFSPGYLMQKKVARQEPFRCIARPNLHRLRLCCDSFFTWSLLRSFRHHFRTIGRAGMVNFKQTQKMILFITCEFPFGQYICELVLDFNVFDLDIRVQIDSIDQPI